MSASSDFPAGVLTGDAVTELFALAKQRGFALPAANCTGSNTINPVMETAAKLNSPVIIQFSHGGGAFVAGKG
ncbi:MAG TPA: class II fructose-bisphosphate aldolase, partial [Ilumatobacteraceae bacterium]|nr:class II fructose-bisphosphate aldolase [Ilumatobacteraceae bacterium]